MIDMSAGGCEASDEGEPVKTVCEHVLSRAYENGRVAWTLEQQRGLPIVTGIMLRRAFLVRNESAPRGTNAEPPASSDQRAGIAECRRAMLPAVPGRSKVAQSNRGDRWSARGR